MGTAGGKLLDIAVPPAVSGLPRPNGIAILSSRRAQNGEEARPSARQWLAKCHRHISGALTVGGCRMFPIPQAVISVAAAVSPRTCQVQSRSGVGGFKAAKGARLCANANLDVFLLWGVGQPPVAWTSQGQHLSVSRESSSPDCSCSSEWAPLSRGCLARGGQCLLGSDCLSGEQVLAPPLPGKGRGHPAHVDSFCEEGGLQDAGPHPAARQGSSDFTHWQYILDGSCWHFDHTSSCRSCCPQCRSAGSGSCICFVGGGGCVGGGQAGPGRAAGKPGSAVRKRRGGPCGCFQLHVSQSWKLRGGGWQRLSSLTYCQPSGWPMRCPSTGVAAGRFRSSCGRNRTATTCCCRS